MGKPQVDKEEVVHHMLMVDKHHPEHSLPGADMQPGAGSDSFPPGVGLDSPPQPPGVEWGRQPEAEWSRQPVAGQQGSSPEGVRSRPPVQQSCLSLEVAEGRLK